MITSAQMRAARALLGIGQKALAELAGVSLPTIQRMEVSDGNVRGNIDSLSKIVEAIRLAGVELISDGTRSEGTGRGVRLIMPQKLATGREMMGAASASTSFGEEHEHIQSGYSS